MKKIIVGLLLIAAFVAIASQRKDKTYNVSPDGGIKRIEHAGFIDMTLEEKEFDTDLMFYSGRCTWRAETGAEGENVQVPVKAFILLKKEKLLRPIGTYYTLRSAFHNLSVVVRDNAPSPTTLLIYPMFLPVGLQSAFRIYPSA